MAKLSGVRNSSKKGGSGIVKFKFVVEKLHKRLLLGRNKGSSDFDRYEQVPEDVKEGHFAVIAEGGEEPKRFVLPLSCLTNPMFLRLLERAAEEYGFDHEGALTIPCRPSELERILAQQWQQQQEDHQTTACNKSSFFHNY
ncbi:Small auxin-up RNA [Sesbania bispinosa]|nr:Small auxin-up RNA [Sesbania bispinosa]